MKLKIFIAYLVVIIGSFVILEYEKEHKIEAYLMKKTQNYQTLYDLHYSKFKQTSKVIYGIFISPEVTEIYKKLQNANKEEQDLYRQQLYDLLINKYKQYSYLKLRQLHFHLPNNHSFLRFHRKEKFGDDLSPYRESVRYVNQTHLATDRFETGRVYSGYRFVYPIKAEDRHLGSVEISFDVLIFTEEFMSNYRVLSNFHIAQSAVDGKVWRDELIKNYVKSNIEGYYNEKQTVAALKTFFPSQKIITPSKKDLKKIAKMLEAGNSFTTRIEALDQAFSFIAIGSSMGAKKPIAYLSIRSDSQYIVNKRRNFYFVFGLIVLFTTIILYLLWRELSRRDRLYMLLEKKVDEKTQDLKELNENLEKRIDERTYELQLSHDELKKAKEKAEESSIAKSEFLANISHELRTPLNAVINYIHLLLQKERDHSKRKYLHIIHSSSMNLLEIINNILDVSTLQKKKFEFKKSDFNPVDEFTSLIKLFEEKAMLKNITLTKHYRTLPACLYGDVVRIKQVIRSLVSNALKFTPEGKRIDIDISYSDAVLKVSVKDQGRGISKAYQSKIFEKFTQEDGSSTREHGGIGLGLNIAYELVKCMGGELKLESEVGVGSHFFFQVPLREGEAKINKVAPQKSLEMTLDTQKPKAALSLEKREELFTQLKEAIQSKRVKKCKPIVEEIEAYSLSESDHKLFEAIKACINRFKFKDALALF